MNTQTRTVDMEIVQAWLMAAADLGIRVTAPFTMVAPSGESEIFEALVHDFGGLRGTVTGRVAADDSRREATWDTTLPIFLTPIVVTTAAYSWLHLTIGSGTVLTTDVRLGIPGATGLRIE
jgi:hypothetical protein